MLNVELELKSEKENAEVRITDPDQYQSIVNAEWNIIYEKLGNYVACGANVILSRLPMLIWPPSICRQKYFCAGRVSTADLNVFKKQLVQHIKHQCMELLLMCWGHVNYSKKNKLVMKDTTFFKLCPRQKLPPFYFQWQDQFWKN